MLLNARLEKEIIDNKITEEKQKNDYKSNYFKDLSEFLKKNPNHRKIFLNSIESNIDDKNSTYNNNSKFDIRCAM
jgi:predicted nucleic acid-binding OB-fold protein